jgi:PPOX class probable F420-dependent enzyme
LPRVFLPAARPSSAKITSVAADTARGADHYTSGTKLYSGGKEARAADTGGSIMKIPDSVRGLIAKAPLAHLTTINQKGGPQVTVVWVGIENEDFVIGHLATHQKVKNIRHDPRVALSMLSETTNAQGLREYLVVYGDARITEGGAAPLLQRLARIYLGPDVDFPPPAMRNIPGFITRIRPVRFAGIGPWGT